MSIDSIHFEHDIVLLMLNLSYMRSSEQIRQYDDIVGNMQIGLHVYHFEGRRGGERVLLHASPKHGGRC